MRHEGPRGDAAQSVQVYGIQGATMQRRQLIRAVSTVAARGGCYVTETVTARDYMSFGTPIWQYYVEGRNKCTCSHV